jgi:hypothetical protein
VFSKDLTNFAAVFQTAADRNGSSGLNPSATSPYLSDIFVRAPHDTIETESLKVFSLFRR